ncbi:MAG: PH domain-containing protein [Acetatifactor sp.]|nr:PH domain-containing protein [Acetatifactor sp.]
MRFKGKNGFIMWFLLVFVLGCAGYFWSIKGGFDSQIGFWGIIIMHAAVVAVIIWFMVRNYITVTDTEIRVSLGMTNLVVEIASVISMKKVFNLVASSGASAQRIEIAYWKDSNRKIVYISPVDQDGFIDAVCGKKPEIRVYQNP